MFGKSPLSELSRFKTFWPLFLVCFVAAIGVMWVLLLASPNTCSVTYIAQRATSQWYYRKDLTPPEGFSGTWLDWRDANTLKGLSTYTDGKLEGVSLLFDQESRLIISREYQEGVLDGLLQYYWLNGVKAIQMRLVDGEPHGECYMWTPNGRQFVSGVYRSGKAYSGILLSRGVDDTFYDMRRFDSYTRRHVEPYPWKTNARVRGAAYRELWVHILTSQRLYGRFEAGKFVEALELPNGVPEEVRDNFVPLEIR